MRKKLLLIGAAATATLFAGGLALAQSHGPGFGPHSMRGEGHAGMGPGMMQQHMGQGMMHQGGHGMGHGGNHGGPGSAFVDPAQIEKLKTELGITPDQEAAWNTYATALQEAADAMKARREGVDPGTVGTLSPAERFAFMTERHEQGRTQFAAVQSAANALLATLDEAQKDKARDVLPGLAFGPGAQHGAIMGGRRHQH